MRLDWRAHDHPAWWAFLVHRISSIALALFLPVHFWALGQALDGEASFDTFLRWTDQPAVKVAEIVLVALLAAHMAGGIRLLMLELLAWRDWQKSLAACAAGATLLFALAFMLNVV